MPILRIKRKREYNNIYRDYKIYVDGNKVGNVSNGETKDFDIEVGKHLIICKIDWCSSPTMQIEVIDKEVKTVEVSSFKYASWLLPVTFGLLLLLPLLKQNNPDIKYLYYLIIPITGLLIYYITVGRRKYLALNEI